MASLARAFVHSLLERLSSAACALVGQSYFEYSLHRAYSQAENWLPIQLRYLNKMKKQSKDTSPVLPEHVVVTVVCADNVN